MDNFGGDRKMKYYGIYLKNRLVTFSNDLNMLNKIINVMIAKGHDVGLREI